jgi:hypothetical protein
MNTTACIRSGEKMSTMEFVPARNKLEAVARISALTSSGPEFLGPGSKERKTVLLNLAAGLQIQTDGHETKQQLGSLIAKNLGVKWVPECESVGQTITLIGLNLLLEAASEKLSSTTKFNAAVTPLDEMTRISNIVKIETPKHMNGMESIIEMKLQEFSKWAETEWQGFYFEFKVKPQLINALGGGPRVIGRTEFDYALNYPWDMKVHSLETSKGKPSPGGCALNDGFSMETAVSDNGLGLILLNGIPDYDWEFTKWFKDFRKKGQGEPRRTLKKTFTSVRVDYFFIPNRARFDEALAKKELTIFNQGKQQSGQKRNYKYSLNLKKAEKSDLLIGSTEIN